jgi:DNA-binding response OmpR family regulator
MEIVSFLEISEWLWKHLKPKKVLLAVEDSSDDKILLCEEMQFVNFKYELASTGEEAMGLLRKTKFNAALIDINLPGMNGFSLAEKIGDKYPKTRIFFMTGSSYVDMKPSTLLRIIRKPITAKVLKELVI